MMKISENITKIINIEAKAIRDIPSSNDYNKAIGIIHSHVHQKKGKLVASGMGKAGQIALNIATTFSATGTPSVFLHPSDAQHGDIGVIQENDVLLLISNSGKTREIIELIELSDKIHKNLPKIVITSNPDSPLGKIADVLILTGAPEEVCPLGLTPTTSTTVMTVIGDILVVLMMDKLKFTAKEYAKRHHGGYLGSKSRSMLNS